MFDEHRAKKAEKEYREALAQWQGRRDGYAEYLELAQSFSGSGSDSDSDSGDIMLAAGEAVFIKVTGASLVEDRRGSGHYEGGSTGVSIPAGSLGGHSVRYRVGANRGHYVQGEPTPTAIDTGTVYLTNKRVIFQGAKQTREGIFAKLIGFQHADSEGSTTFSVSNRQTPTTVHYGPKLSGDFDFRLDLALAHFRGTASDLFTQLQQELAQLDAGRPVAPADLPG